MGSKLYVGNLPFDTDSSELKLAFSQCGSVTDAKIVTDRETGRSRGFAFVTMGSPDEAQAAISSWDGRSFGNRNLIVNEAIEKPRGSSNNRGQQSFIGSNGSSPNYGARRVVVENPERSREFTPVTPPSDFGNTGRKRRRGGSRARRQEQEDDSGY
jgi:cold-inducible RNA-binding protein